MVVRRVLTVVVLIIGLLTQGLVSAHAMPDIEAAVHAASHGSMSHHHEDDGSTHFDSSDESTQHMQADHCNGCVGALPGSAYLAGSPLHRVTAERARSDPPPEPFLEGPHRPPRLRA